jgi:hypothetical protein
MITGSVPPDGRPSGPSRGWTISPHHRRGLADAGRCRAALDPLWSFGLGMKSTLLQRQKSAECREWEPAGFTPMHAHIRFGVAVCVNPLTPERDAEAYLRPLWRSLPGDAKMPSDTPVNVEVDYIELAVKYTGPNFGACEFVKEWHEKINKINEYESKICDQCRGLYSKDLTLLSQIKIGSIDKLQNSILQIYLCGEDYKIYRTRQGVNIHFSDCRRREREQRAKYEQIFNKLSYLRFLTSQMFRVPLSDRLSISGGRMRRSGGFYDNQIAEAICLSMEERIKEANETLDRGIDLASSRNTNENRIRYIAACLAVALLLVLPLWLLYLLSSKWPLPSPPDSHHLLLAAGVGALGAVFSISTRVQKLKLHPCEQSVMNYIMGALRVLIGFASGALIFLLATRTEVGKPITALFDPKLTDSWHGIALLGFFGGFAERLVPFLLGKLDSKAEG